MRILLVGGYGVGQSLQDLAEGFWQDGHQVRHVPFMGNVADPELLRQAMWSDAFDLIIGFCMFYSDDAVLDIIRKTRTPHYLWNFDCPHREISEPDMWTKQARAWTGVLCCADGDVVRDFYHSRDIEYRSCFPPPAIDVREFDHKQTADDAASLTTTFIGQCYDPQQFPRVVVPRTDVGRAITDAFGDRAQIFGNKWDPPRTHLQWQQTFYYWGLPTTTIGHHGEKDASIYFNGRDCRAMGAGAAYIVDRANRMDMTLEEGVHALFYSTTGELIEKIMACEADPDLCLRLGANAREYILRDYSQRRTAQRMLGATLDDSTAISEGECDFTVLKTVGSDACADDERLMNEQTDYDGAAEGALLRSTCRGNFCNAEDRRSVARVRLHGPNGHQIGYAAVIPKTVASWSVAGVSAVSWNNEWRRTVVPGLVVDAVREVGEKQGYDATVAWITKEAAPLWQRCGFFVHPNRKVAVRFNNRTIIEDYFWSELFESDPW